MLTKSFNFAAPPWLEAAVQQHAGDLALLGTLVALFVWEVRSARRRHAAKTNRQSYLANLGTFLMNDTLMSLMSVSALLLLAQQFTRFGLLHLVSEPVARTVMSFLLLDLTLYAWHRANHSFACLWMFHKVHHSDQSMNVSTAFRLHFVEVVFTTVVKALFVVVTGVQAAVLLANEAVITLMVMFHHANIGFRGEPLLGRLIVVPYLHRAHHSTLRKEHDHNYGFVFSFWDRLFGTLIETEPRQIGLESVPGMNALQLVIYGLSKNWLPAAQPIPPSPQALEKMIAEAAYYRAKARNFAPGHDILDWLESEKEIRARIRNPGRTHSFLACCR